MDFELSEEQRAIQDTARAFARDEMMPHAKAWDENSTFPVETLRKAAALGFGGIYVKDDVLGRQVESLGSGFCVTVEMFHHRLGSRGQVDVVCEHLIPWNQVGQLYQSAIMAVIQHEWVRTICGGAKGK